MSDARIDTQMWPGARPAHYGPGRQGHACPWAEAGGRRIGHLFADCGEFPAAAGEAAAGLGGLLLVAVSLDHKDILSEPRLPPLAARSLGVLLSILLMSVLAVTPGQSRTTVGAELTALDVFLVGAVTISAARTHLRVTKLGWTATTFLLALASSVPMVIAGVTMLAGAGGGLYWAMVQVILGFSIALYYAWILLIEILR